MANEEDWDEMDEMLTIIERQVSSSLKKINQSRRRRFDRTFKEAFIRAINDRVTSAYSKFEAKLEMGPSSDQTASTSAGGNNTNLADNCGTLRTIKVESNNEIVDISDDDDHDVIITPKAEGSKALGQRAIRRNEQKETVIEEQPTPNNRSILNSESSAIELVADNNSEIESEVTNDSPLTSSGMGAKNKDESTNTERPVTVGKPRPCDKAGKSADAKNVTKTAKDKQKRHKCQICGYATHRKGHLNQHNRIHTGERPYQCNKCSKSFSHSFSFQTHQLIHVRQYKFRCVGCARGFNEEIEKVRHDKVCGKRRYECYLCKIDPPDCDRTYTTNLISHLKPHMLKHTGEKLFRCEICMKRFGEKRSLKRHLHTIHNRANR